MGKETLPIEAAATEIVEKQELGGSAFEPGVDTELRLDGESDSLYGDGIELEEEFDTPAGTPGSLGTIP